MTRQVKRSRKILIIVISVMVLATVVFILAGLFIHKQIQKKIRDQIASLRNVGVDVLYDNVSINLWAGSLTVYQLKVKLNADSLIHPVEATVPYALIKNIDLFSVLVRGTFSIESISLYQPSIVFVAKSRMQKADRFNEKKTRFKNILVEHLDLKELVLFVKDSLSHDTLAHVNANIRIDRFGFEPKADSLLWKEPIINVSGFSMKFPKDLYACTAKDIQLHMPQKTFQIDSLKIKPTHTRRQFMKHFGKEIDYVSGVIPFAKIKGISWTAFPRSLAFDKLRLQFFLTVYRDKRYPFRKSKQTVLPSHFLQRLPWQLRADTVSVENSFVSYEEFPAKGDSSGLIYFDKLNAVIIAPHNHPHHDAPVHMKVNSKFMGQGDLSVRFTFPTDTTKPYTARGALTNFPLAHLNQTLGSAANLKVQSGVMTNFKFNFAYNMYRSDGRVELNYNDLSVASLRENKNNEQAVSTIKTLLLNMFIIKKDMDDQDDERYGTILFHRNTKRSIFNYWWKSIFSGIRSAFKLDKLQGSEARIPLSVKFNKQPKQREPNSLPPR